MRPLLFPLPKGEGQGEGEERVIRLSGTGWLKFRATVIFPVCVYPCPSVVKTNSVA